MNDDEREKRLRQLAAMLSESEAIFKTHPFVRRKIEEAFLLADFDKTRILEILMEWCEQDKEFGRVINSLAGEQFLTAWDEKGREQH